MIVQILNGVSNDTTALLAIVATAIVAGSLLWWVWRTENNELDNET